MPTESPVAEPVLDSPVAALPDSAKAALPAVSADFDVDKFFPGEKPAAKPAAVVPAPAKPAVVSADDAPPPPKTLGQQIAAKAAKPAEPAPAAAPVAEGDPEDKLEVDAKSSPATREHFKTLKGVTKTLRTTLQQREQTISELTTKLETAAKAPSATETAELVRLREEAKALSDRLLLIDTKNHPKFKAQFDEPKAAALAAAKQLLGENPADVAKLLELPRAELGRAIGEITKDLPDLDRRDVTDSLYKAWQLEQQGREALAKAGETNGAIRAKTVEEQKALFGARFEKVVPGLAEHIVRLEVPVTATAAERQSIEEYNNAALGIRAAAEKVALGQIDEDSVVQHATKSAAYDFHVQHVMPRIAREMSDMQEVITGLQKELKMYHGKNPKRDIGASLVETKSSAPTSIEEIADAHYKK